MFELQFLYRLLYTSLLFYNLLKKKNWQYNQRSITIEKLYENIAKNGILTEYLLI